MQLAFKDGRTKALTLSYDDGVYEDRKLIEIMNRYSIKGTFNLNSGCWWSEDVPRQTEAGRLKLSEAKELYANSGHEVALHGLTHPWIASLGKSEMTYEVMQDRLNLEKEFGCIVRGMAYPFGCFNDTLLGVLDNCGIVYSRTTAATESFELPSDWLRLNPTCHHKCPHLMELTDRFINEDIRFSQARLFYLWGHSYEFRNDNNWNLIEEFCARMAGHDDIWYATNIEIYDYVMSYKSLVVSADGRRVYNPSCNPVWFLQGKDVLKVEPGKELTF